MAFKNIYVQFFVILRFLKLDFFFVFLAFCTTVHWSGPPAIRRTRVDVAISTLLSDCVRQATPVDERIPHLRLEHTCGFIIVVAVTHHPRTMCYEIRNSSTISSSQWLGDVLSGLFLTCWAI